MHGIKTNLRREKIIELLEQTGEVNVVQLAMLFDVSQVTIRSDLNEMAEANLLKRVHSGAISIKTAGKAYYEATFNERMNINKLEKIKIAKACASLINDGDTIIIDSGTTALYLAKELSLRSNLTIVTNAMLVAQELLYNRSVKVILLGGDVDYYHQFTYGNDTITQLHRYRADKFILSTDGIDVKCGLTTYHHLEAEVSRSMMDRVNQVIAIADHSKIGREGFAYIAPIAKVNLIITDVQAHKSSELEKIKQEKIEVIAV